MFTDDTVDYINGCKICGQTKENLEYDSDEEALLCESCKYPDPEECYTCKQKTKDLQYVPEGNKIFPVCETCKQKMDSEEEEEEYTCESCKQGSPYSSEESASNSEEDEYCETCIQGQEMQESPYNSEESETGTQEDEYKCKKCMQKQKDEELIEKSPNEFALKTGIE